jgi:hypothetical protein
MKLDEHGVSFGSYSVKRIFAWPTLVLTLCVASVIAQSTEPPKEQPATVSREERTRLQKPRTVTPVPAQEWPATAPASESQPLPEQVRSKVIADAARRAATGTEAITIVSSQVVQWPDGSLGCPEPDEIYPQSPVAGYRVSVKAKGRAYDYRVGLPAHATDAQMQIRVCEVPPGIRAVEEPAPTPPR